MRSMTITVFTGGRILTMDPAFAAAETVVVEDGRIAAVGGAGLEARFPGAHTVDLAGATLTPGFIDAHQHLSVAALHPRWADLSHVTNLEDLGDALREQAAREPDAEWVRGFDHDQNQPLIPLTKTDLDALGLDRPVIVAHYTLHQCVVSSAGLDALGIGRTTPDPAGGQIGRGPDGEPTGFLLEQAWSEAHARSLAGYTDRDRWSELVATKARLLLSSGITAIHDAATSAEAEAMYRSMASAGTLPISVLAMPHPAALLSNDLGGRIDGPVTGEGDETFRIGAVKLFADGGSSIALDVHVHGEPLVLGISMLDMSDRMAKAVDRGFRVGVHAMGNRGVQDTIDAFTAVARAHPDDDHRFRIEHAGIASRDQCRMLASLGAVAVVQPGFVDHVGESARTMRFDDATWLPFGDLAEAGVTLAGSSDEPCAPFPPIWGATRGALRTTVSGLDFEPDQAVPFESWLEAYTRGAAYAGGQEGERGSITPGKRADLVVLEGALDANDPPAVTQTWVAGDRAWSA
jgi:predicted amidohydrolase YtcJ